MAEINIERKERSVWPWLLAGVLLLGLVWFLFGQGTTDTVATDTAADSAYRDTSAAAGTLSQPPAGTARDTQRVPR